MCLVISTILAEDVLLLELYTFVAKTKAMDKKDYRTGLPKIIH